MVFKRILVALDRSLEASAVFDAALSIAQPDISEMLLVHFIDWQTQEVPSWTGFATLYDVNVSSDRHEKSRQQLQQKIERTQHWLEMYAERAIASRLSCEVASRVGHCNLGIGNLAKEWDADLIVIGRRGHKNISEMLLGSVSNYVIHHAPCSVFVVQGTKVSEAEELGNMAEV